MASKPQLITVTKMEAAQRQLDTAIRLWFAKGDSVSIHTLAYASHEIIHRAFRQAGHSNLLFDTSSVDESKRAEWARQMKGSANFFKHSKVERSDDKIEFDASLNVVYIVMSVVALEALKIDRSDEEFAFCLWHSLHVPGLFRGFQKKLKEKAPPDLMAELSLLERHEFLKAYETRLATRLVNVLGVARVASAPFRNA